MPITYLTGDATDPQTDGNAIIAHVCNDVGAWGKGFVLAISRRWKEPEHAYRIWFARREHNDFGLGAVQIVQVKTNRWVANMIAQHGLKRVGNAVAFRYDALETCLRSVCEQAHNFACLAAYAAHWGRTGRRQVGDDRAHHPARFT